MHLHKNTYVRAAAIVTLGLMISSTGVENIFGFTVYAAELVKDDGFQTMAKLIGGFSLFLEILVYAVFQILQFLLDPVFILDLTSQSGHGRALNAIWKFSRDVMNVIFAFMLITAGIYTVITANKELVMNKYKKFILAIILVNFSWFFPQVILDVANVLAASVYQIPSAIHDPGIGGIDLSCKRWPNGRVNADGSDRASEDCISVKKVKFFRGDCKDAGDPPDGGEPYIKKASMLCVSFAPLDPLDIDTPVGVFNALVMNYGRLPQLTQVLKKDTAAAPPGAPVGAGGEINTEKLQELFNFLLTLAIGLLMMILLGFPLIAMFIVFLIRIPIIWLTIAFMPFMFIGFVIGDKMGGFDSMKIFQHYVKAAFLPAAVAVPIVVGYILIAVLTSTASGCPFGDVDVISGLCGKPGSPIILGIKRPVDLMWMIMSFLVLWIGFFSALKIDDIYVSATAGLKSMGEGMGKTALKLPLAVPIIPSGTKDGKTTYMTPLGIDDKARGFSSAISGGKSIGQAFSSNEGAKTIVEAMNNPQSATNQALVDIATNMKLDNKSSAADIETAINVQLTNPDSDLNQGLKKNGVDPSSVTAAQIRNSLSQSLNDTVKKIGSEPAAPTTPPAAPTA